MPITLFSWDEQGKLQELGVRMAQARTTGSNENTPFELAQRAASNQLNNILSQRMPPLPGYQSEINLRAEAWIRSEEHTSELQSLMRISYAVFCLKKKHQTDKKRYKHILQSNQQKQNYNITSDI